MAAPAHSGEVDVSDQRHFVQHVGFVPFLLSFPRALNGLVGNEITPALAASNGEASIGKVWERSFWKGTQACLGEGVQTGGPRPCARQGQRP